MVDTMISASTEDTATAKVSSTRMSGSNSSTVNKPLHEFIVPPFFTGILTYYILRHKSMTLPVFVVT